MSRAIELTDEDYVRLERAATQEGITPAEWIARRIPRWAAEPRLGPDGQPAKTMADLFAGRVGLAASGGGGRFSENTGEKFAGDLVENHGAAEAGVGGAKPRTMAERLAGRLGTLSGSGGRPSSDNVAQSFAEHLEVKQRAERL